MLRLDRKGLEFVSIENPRTHIRNLEKNNVRTIESIIIYVKLCEDGPMDTSQESSLQCICFYGVGRISDHAINQFIYLWHNKATETRKEGSENFDGKLHLRKQIKVQLRGMSMSINHNQRFIS